MKRATLVLLMWAGCGSPQARAENPGLQIGVAAVDITPPVGYRLGGYFKDRFANEIRDPIHAKAIVFAQRGTRAALVLCDLVGVPAWISEKARQQAQARTGIPAAHIAVAGTHTHTGPYLPANPQQDHYLPALVDRLVDVIVRARRRS